MLSQDRRTTRHSARDAQFWEAYSRCDLAAMEGFLTADVEFYHDQFYVRSGNEPERLTGIARFTHLWLLRHDTWQMARILSYDHRPASAR